MAEFPSLTLYALPREQCGQAARLALAAAYAGVKIHLIMPDKDSEWDVELGPGRSALNTLPFLETPEGILSGGRSILRYMLRIGSRTIYYNTNAFAASQVDEWISRVSGDMLPYILPLFSPETSDVFKLECVRAVEQIFALLNQHLVNCTYLVGERFTWADCEIALIGEIAFQAIKSPALFKNKEVLRHMKTVLNHPAFIDACEAADVHIHIPTPPKPAPVAKAPSKKAPPAKASKPAAKKVNPLDKLPNSSFVLDAFKREYSNTDTRTVAAPYLFSNFDEKGWSMWWCTYKYNEENTAHFRTTNLVRGWFQRMDRCRKYIFGIALLLGTNEQHDINGFFVIRGTSETLPECLLEVDDTELYEWHQIKDPHAEQEKITDYLCWEGPTITKEVLEGRVFK